MNRRDQQQRQQRLSTAASFSPFVNSPAPITDRCTVTHYGADTSSKCARVNKKMPKNKVLLKLCSPSELVTSGDHNSNNNEASSIRVEQSTSAAEQTSAAIRPHDEFTLTMRTFEAAFADGSKVFFRRDCFHRLLTVSSGSSVVIDDAPYDSTLSPLPPATASSLSQAFTSCNRTGLAWLSTEARATYLKALEVLSHCEKLEATLIQIVAQNRHLKLPFVIGRIQQQQQQPSACLLNDATGKMSPYRQQQQPTQHRYLPGHPFHAFHCPYCLCYANKTVPIVTISKVVDDQIGVIVDISSNKDGSSSGIASKSVSPPNFAVKERLLCSINNTGNCSSNIKATEYTNQKLSSKLAIRDRSEIDEESHRPAVPLCKHRRARLVDVDLSQLPINSVSVAPTATSIGAGSSCKILKNGGSRVTKTFKAKNASNNQNSQLSVKYVGSVTSQATSNHHSNNRLPGNNNSCNAVACTQCLGEAVDHMRIKTREVSCAQQKPNVKSLNSTHQKQPKAERKTCNSINKPVVNETDSSLCRQMLKFRQRHHPHIRTESKRKVVQTYRHNDSRQALAQQPLRSLKNAPDSNKYEACTPVSRCRDKGNKKSIWPVRLGVNDDIQGESPVENSRNNRDDSNDEETSNDTNQFCETNRNGQMLDVLCDESRKQDCFLQSNQVISY